MTCETWAALRFLFKCQSSSQKNTLPFLFLLGSRLSFFFKGSLFSHNNQNPSPKMRWDPAPTLWECMNMICVRLWWSGETGQGWYHWFSEDDSSTAQHFLSRWVKRQQKIKRRRTRKKISSVCICPVLFQGGIKTELCSCKRLWIHRLYPHIETSRYVREV